MLKAFLLEGFFWHDEVFVAETYFVFGGWRIAAVLRVVVPNWLVGVTLPFLPTFLFGSWFDEGVWVFGILRSIIFSGVGISFFVTA